LLTLFHKFAPELLKGGYVYAAMPPLYRLNKGRADPVWIANDEELESFLSDKVKSQWNIQRFKGLGEMNPEQLWETTMSPETRSLMQIQYEEFDIENPTFELLMGIDVPPRRQFIEENACYATIDA
jgi:DNA gyrase subunit B